MPTVSVTVQEAEGELDQLIRRAVSGDEIIIDDGIHGRVRLEPLPAPTNERRIGGLPGFVLWMAEDFSEPVEDFREYMP